MTDRQTDGRTPGDDIYRAYAYASRGKNQKTASDPVKAEADQNTYSRTKYKIHLFSLFQMGQHSSEYRHVPVNVAWNDDFVPC